MIAAVLGASAESGKYPERNWERGLTQEQLIGSIRRHLNKVQQHEFLFDTETGLPEYAMLLCNAAMLATLAYRRHDPEGISAVDLWAEKQRLAVGHIRRNMEQENV